MSLAVDTLGLQSPSSFGKSSSKIRAWSDWPPHEEHDELQQRALAAVQLHEAELARGGRASDPQLARKFARSKFKLWSFTLKRSIVESAQEAYRRALAMPSLRDNAAMWVESALLTLSSGKHTEFGTTMERILDEQPTYVGKARLLLLRLALWLRDGKFDDAVKCTRCGFFFCIAYDMHCFN
jgi:hypothetical protein